MPKTPMVKVAGLWLNTTRDGQKYYSGTLGGLKVFLFKSKSDHPKAPTFNLFLAERSQEQRGNYRKRDEDKDEEPSRTPKAPDDMEDEAPKKTKEEEDDDLPF